MLLDISIRVVVSRCLSFIPDESSWKASWIAMNLVMIWLWDKHPIKNMFFSNYVPSLFLGLLTCPNPCLVGPCTQSRRYWWRLPSPLLPGWYYISLTTFHQVWNIFLVVLSRDLELFEITSMMWILPICLLSLNTEFCNTTRTLGKLEPIWDHFRTLIPIGPYW